VQSSHCSLRLHDAPIDSIRVFDQGEFSAVPSLPGGPRYRPTAHASEPGSRDDCPPTWLPKDLRPTQEGERAISFPRSVERSAAFEGS
jgi:hypothetical protein